MRYGGDDLLGEDVEGLRRMEVDSTRPSCMAPGDGGAGDEVGAVFGEDDAFARGSDLVPARPMRCMPAATEAATRSG